MAAFSLPEAEALLERFPAALTALLSGLPRGWTHSQEGEGTWTAYDVIGHLIHCEHADWLPRTRHLLAHGETRAFDPFDREAMKRQPQDLPLEQLLTEFAQLRAASLAELRGLKLQPADLARPGLHPRLGKVTLGQLLATWPAHDLTHLHQLSRLLAHQCQAAVGPWSVYLGVLHCSAHGAA